MLRVSKSAKPRQRVDIAKAASTKLEDELAAFFVSYYAENTTPDQITSILDALDQSSLAKLYEVVGMNRLDRTAQLAAILASSANPKAVAAFNAILATNPAAKIAVPGAIDIAFNVIDPRVQAWAYSVSSSLIVQIEAEMRDSIQTMVGDAVSGKYTKQQLASRISRIIPLHDRYRIAVEKRHAATLSAYLKGGTDVDEAFRRAGVEADRYAARLTRLRARTIARTELMFSENNGTFIGQSAAVQAGMTSAAVYKEWITAEDEDVCPICGPLDGTRVPFSELFSTGQFTPPGHPNCRCSYNMVDEGLLTGIEDRYTGQGQVSYAGF